MYVYLPSARERVVLGLELVDAIYSGRVYQFDAGRTVTVRVARRLRLLAVAGAVAQAAGSGAGAGMTSQRRGGLVGRRLRELLLKWVAA